MQVNLDGCLSDARVPLLIWLYSDSSVKETNLENIPAVFLYDSDCCNGLTLDTFQLLRRTKVDRPQFES